MITTMALLSASAQAGPFQMLQPARTMATGETEMGGGIGYNAGAASLDQGTVLLSGWGRYGLTDRVEVSGGASASTATSGSGCSASRTKTRCTCPPGSASAPSSER